MLISIDKFQTIENNPEYIETLRHFNVFFFDCDEKRAVKFILNNYGYDCFTVSGHGYVGG